jgi:hypothetical protein
MTDMFEMFMMGELTFFLKFQNKQVKDETFINQTKYNRDILKKFGINNANPIKTFMGTNGHLDLDMGGTSTDQKVYQFIIGLLLYLCVSRSDIMLSVCMCKITSRTKKLSFKGRQHNHELSSSNS